MQSVLFRRILPLRGRFPLVPHLLIQQRSRGTHPKPVQLVQCERREGQQQQRAGGGGGPVEGSRLHTASNSSSHEEALRSFRSLHAPWMQHSSSGFSSLNRDSLRAKGDVSKEGLSSGFQQITVYGCASQGEMSRTEDERYTLLPQTHPHRRSCCPPHCMQGSTVCFDPGILLVPGPQSTDSAFAPLVHLPPVSSNFTPCHYHNECSMLLP